MSDTHYRTYSPDLELSRKGDGRTIFGIAVPYGKPSRVPHEGIVEQFARGAFANQVRAPYRVPFTRGHIDTGGSIIGVTKLLREDAAGLYGEWRVSKTALGDETLALVEDGALRDLSIGFDEVPNGNRQIHGGIVERVRSTLREVATVVQGIYGEMATAQGIRSMIGEPWEPPPATPNLDLVKEILAGLPPLS